MKTTDQNGTIRNSTRRLTGRCLSFALFVFVFWVAQITPQTAELVVETGLTASFPSVLFSSDGRILACIDGGRSVKLWDVRTRGFLKAFSLHEVHERYSIVSAIAFSKAGYRLAVAHHDRTITVLDIESGQVVTSMYTDHFRGAIDLAFDADGKSFVSVDGAGKVIVWDTNTGTELRSFESITENRLPNVQFAPDGKTMVTFGHGIELWDVGTGSRIWSIPKQPWFITSIAFSTDSKILVSGGMGSRLDLWNAADGSKLRSIELDTLDVTALSISTKGESIAFGDKHGNIGVLDPKTGRRRWSAVRGEDEIRSVRFTPDDTMLASSTPRSIEFWKATDGTKIESPSSRGNPMSWAAVSRDGRTFALPGSDGSLKLLHTAGEMFSIDGSVGYTAVAFTRDGTSLALGFGDGRVQLRDVANGKLRKTLKGTESVWALAFSADSEMLAVSHSGAIHVWSLERKERRLSIPTPKDMTVLGFSEDGKTLAGKRDIEIGLWDLTTGESKITANEFERLAQALAEVPDLLYNDKSGPAYENLRSAEITLAPGDNGEINVYSRTHFASIFQLDNTDWVVTTPDGRFDTNKSLDNIKGLHWIVNDEILKPVPLEAFMRHYYEPNLLSRVMKCNKDNTCEQEFKPLPPIGAINRVQSIAQKPRAAKFGTP